MYTMGRERALPGSLGQLSRRRTPVAGIGGLPVVLIYLAVNSAVIRAFRTEFRDEFRLGPHLLIPAAASVVFLFPLWASCSRVPTRWRTCCPSFRSAGS